MPNTYEKPIYSKALIELAVNEGYSLIKKILTKGTTIKFGIEAINPNYSRCNIYIKKCAINL